MYMLAFVWKSKCGRAYTLLRGIAALLAELLPLFYVIFPGLIINELTGNRDIRTIMIYIGLIIGLPLLGQVLTTILDQRLNVLQLALKIEHEVEIFAYTADMEYEILEHPDTQSARNRAGMTLGGIAGIIDLVCSLISNSIGLIAILSIVATLNPLLIALIVGIAYINSFITKRITNKLFALNIEASRYDNIKGRLYWMLYSFDYAKEMRVFNLKDWLIQIYTTKYTEANRVDAKSFTLYQTLSRKTALTNFIQQLALYAYVVYSVIARGLSIGGMTIYMGVAAQFSGTVGGLFGAYSQLSGASLQVQDMLEFFNIPNKSKTGKLIPGFDSDSTIEFRNVSFKYPGNEVYALRDVCLTIRGSEKLCIVGANGAGKSTFVKLLLRLYQPESGEILLNGVNINEYEYGRYLKLFAPVFQDFQRYSLTLRDNIVLSAEYDEARLRDAGLRGGLEPLLQKLPKGYDSVADKGLDENGFTPSGGEEQRIAIARALYRDATFYLLDEPTAALDPIAEYEIYTKFSEMIRDKGALLITHRMSAVQLADKVAVFENGAIVEYGTHKELYQKGALYTEMFDKQAQFYVDSTHQTEIAETEA
jgi:ATP-binding cassette subfamily B protein/ATP-binding cassette subfamily C protein